MIKSIGERSECGRRPGAMFLSCCGALSWVASFIVAGYGYRDLSIEPTIRDIGSIPALEFRQEQMMARGLAAAILAGSLSISGTLFIFGARREG